MQKFRMKLCERKPHTFCSYETYLLDKDRPTEYFDNYLRWKFYKIK